MHNSLSLVTHVQFGLSLLDQSFWNIVFFQAENISQIVDGRLTKDEVHILLKIFDDEMNLRYKIISN